MVRIAIPSAALGGSGNFGRPCGVSMGHTIDHSFSSVNHFRVILSKKIDRGSARQPRAICGHAGRGRRTRRGTGRALCCVGLQAGRECAVGVLRVCRERTAGAIRLWAKRQIGTDRRGKMQTGADRSMCTCSGTGRRCMAWHGLSIRRGSQGIKHLAHKVTREVARCTREAARQVRREGRRAGRGGGA